MSKTKTYIMQLEGGGIRKVEVPATWKMTFGLTAPYAKKEYGYKGLALRFYEGSEKNLRAVFTDVIAVRDASFSVLERKSETQRKVVQKHTAQGAKDVVIEAKVTEWINPDADENIDESNPFAEALKPEMKKLMSPEDLESVPF